MDLIATKLVQLRDRVQSIAFLVSKGESAKHVHSEIVQALVVVAEIERAYLGSEPPQQNSEMVQKSAVIVESDREYSSNRSERESSAKSAAEVKRVSNKLHLWARPDRQQNINSRILNGFLKLERSGIAPIRESDLRRELSGIDSFGSNFAQMKIIAERSHGKIFEQDGDVITIWEPVLPYVREYQKALARAS